MSVMSHVPAGASETPVRSPQIRLHDHAKSILSRAAMAVHGGAFCATYPLGATRAHRPKGSLLLELGDRRRLGDPRAKLEQAGSRELCEASELDTPHE